MEFMATVAREGYAQNLILLSLEFCAFVTSSNTHIPLYYSLESVVGKPSTFKV